jgi:hypothetical protein
MSLSTSHSTPRLAPTVAAILAVATPGLVIAATGRSGAAAASVTVTALLARLLRDLAGGSTTPRPRRRQSGHERAPHR